MLGVAVLIIVIAVMTGFDRELRQKLVGFNAHLKIVNVNGPLDHPEAVMDRVRGQPHVRGIAPFVLNQALFQTQPADPTSPVHSFAPFVRGMDSELEGQVSAVTNSLVQGTFDLSGNGLLIGAQLAEDYRLRVGDQLAVYSSRAIEKMMRSVTNTHSQTLTPAENYEIRGIFSIGHYQVDQLFTGISLANAQDLFALGDSVNGLSVLLDDLSEDVTRAAQQQLGQQLGASYRVISWMDENGSMLGAIEDEKSAMLVILFFVMIVAAFCIVCSQIAFVIRKTREIGILKGIGATTGQVVAVFFLQSFAVGCLGVVCGWWAGLAGVAVRNDFLKAMRWITGRDLFSPAVYNFTGLPAQVLPRDVALICGVSLVMCLVAGVVPALIVATMRPVEALRNE